MACGATSGPVGARKRVNRSVCGNVPAFQKSKLEEIREPQSCRKGSFLPRLAIHNCRDATTAHPPRRPRPTARTPTRWRRHRHGHRLTSNGTRRHLGRGRPASHMAAPMAGRAKPTYSRRAAADSLPPQLRSMQHPCPPAAGSRARRPSCCAGQGVAVRPGLLARRRLSPADRCLRGRAGAGADAQLPSSTSFAQLMRAILASACLAASTLSPTLSGWCWRASRR